MNKEYEKNKEQFEKIAHPMKPVESVVVDEPVGIPDDLKDDFEKEINPNDGILKVYQAGYENCFNRLSNRAVMIEKSFADKKSEFDEKANLIISICSEHEHEDRKGCKLCDISDIIRPKE